MILLLAAAVLAVGAYTLIRALDTTVYVTVVNETAGDIYGVGFYFSYSGGVFPHLEEGDGWISASQPRTGSNEYIPFAPGEEIKMKLPRGQGGTVPSALTAEFFVEMSPTALRQDRVPTVGPMEVPIEAGKRSVVVLTGSRETGFSVAFRGIE